MNESLPRSNFSPSVPTSGPSFPSVDPTGLPIRIPLNADEDFAYFSPDQVSEIKQYYLDQGYVVVRKLFPRSTCDAALEWFDKEIKPSNRYIYRQATASPERHVFTPHGFMLNTILNIQSLDASCYPNFRNAGLAFMTHPDVQALLLAILGEAGKLVQSMYFQSNSPAGTGAHQDSYYLDSEEFGCMVGAWYAMEDIAPGAGRFYVYPKSHTIDMAKTVGYADLAFNRDRYEKVVIDAIRDNRLECRVPALQQGDALFWSSRMIHGSLRTTQPDRSRSSFTAHYIPDSSRLLQFQARIHALDLQTIGGMRVHKPKDLSRASRRAILWLETTFPRTFRATKKIAVKALLR